MALEQKLHLKLAQRLVMTPTLQQAIKLLQLSRLELEQTLAQEVQVNPVLELTEEAPVDEELAAGVDPEPTATSASGEEGEAGDEPATVGDQLPAPTPTETAADDRATPGGEENSDTSTDSFGEVDLDALFTNYLHDAPQVGSSWEEGDETPLDNSPAPQASLYDAVASQLQLIEVPSELRAICDFIAGNLDPDGYLRISSGDLANQLGIAVEKVDEAISWVQKVDPAGIGARDLRECFLIQLDRREWDQNGTPLALVRQVVSEGLDDLLHQRWERIVQRFGVPHDNIRAILEVIRKLDPRPGVALGPSDNSVIEPDVIVVKVGDAWRITLNDEGLPRLRLSSRYVRLLQSRALDGETSGYLRERMRAALWFLRSVEQRQNTIIRVADAIVRRQREFLDHGISHLRPLVLRDIADDIGMHESTVSRVVANKFISTPRGVFALKFFFHSAISHALDGDISSVVVKERIKELIASEEPHRPLSDARVARQLNRLGIRIARRTVAKYREELDIPSSEQRRRTLK